jgi:hypothetical protein
LATFHLHAGYRSALRLEWSTRVPAPGENVVGPNVRHRSLAQRLALHAPRPTGYCPTPTAELSRSARGPIPTGGSAILVCAMPSDSCGKNHPFSTTCRRPTADHSVVAGGDQRHPLQACLLELDGQKRRCPSLPLVSTTGGNVGGPLCRLFPGRLFPKLIG